MNEDSKVVSESNEESSALGQMTKEVKRGHLAFVNANIYQAAILNKILPPGFRIEVEDTVKRNYEYK